MIRKTNGITLIALVITIIILIIITGISIAMVKNDQGVINKTEEAKKMHEITSAQEYLEMLKGPLQLREHRVNLESYMAEVENAKAKGKGDITSWEYVEDTKTNEGYQDAYITISGKYIFLAADNGDGEVDIIYNGKPYVVTIDSPNDTYILGETKTFTITNYDSNKTYIVESEDNNIATATISGNTVTVTANTKRLGTTKINVITPKNGIYAAGKAIHEVTVKNKEIILSVIPYTGIFDNQEHPAFTQVIVDPSDAKIEYSLNGGEFTQEMPKVKGASEEGYTITVTASKEGYITTTITEKVIIEKQGNTIGNLELSETSGTLTYPEQRTFTITNNASGGALSVSSANTNIANVELSGNTVTVIPGTIAGETTITVKSAETNDYEEQTVTYSAKVQNGEIIISETPYNGNYDGKNHPVFTVFTVNPSDAKVEYSLNGGAYTTTMPTVNGASTYTIAVKASKAGYTTKTVTETVIVNKSATSTSAPTLKTGLVYNRTAQALITAGSSSGGTIYYGLGGSATSAPSNWSTSLPTGTNAGTYYVWYKVTGDSNHTNIGATYKGAVTIGAKPIGSCTITLGYTSTTYTGSALTPSVTVKDGSTTLTTNTDYTVSYSNNVNVGTATVTVTGKGNYTGTKSTTFRIEYPSLVSQVTSANYGDKVNYSVTVNGVTLNNWKIFYNDGNNVIMIYNDYLPNSTGIAENAGLETSGTYNVYATTGLFPMVDILDNTSKWSSLIRSDLNGKATAKGAVDLETWVASWNAKGYMKLYTKTIKRFDGLNGYYIGTSENPTSDELSISSNVGYTDSLYFPHHDFVNGSCMGYWIDSYSSTSNYWMMRIDYYGKIACVGPSYGNSVICPAIYLNSSVLTSGKDASGAWVIE